MGRKDRRTCEDEHLLHHTNAKINFCNCMYHGFKECKPEGNKPICTEPRSDCMTSVSGYSKTALTSKDRHTGGHISPTRGFSEKHFDCFKHFS